MGVYLWGDNPMDARMAVVGICFGAFFNSMLLWMQGGEDGYVTEEELPTRDDFVPMFWVTILWSLLHLSNSFVGAAQSTFHKKSPEEARFINGRIIGNMNEWSLMFLVLFW